MVDDIDIAFDKARDHIGEEDIARVALEYWMNVDHLTELCHSQPWHMYMLMFQLGYIYGKKGSNIND